MTTYESNPEYSQKPGLVQTIAIMTLVNGILNILWGLTLAIALTAGIVTLCLVPFSFLPVVLGIFEIVYASQLLGTQPKPVKPSLAIAILEICCILFFNAISLIVGILALIFYNDARVKEYFAALNG